MTNWFGDTQNMAAEGVATEGPQAAGSAYPVPTEGVAAAVPEDADAAAEIGADAIRLLSLAALIEVEPLILRLRDSRVDDQIRSTIRAFAKEGIARNAAVMANGDSIAQINRAAHQALEAIEHSPLPDHEWPAMLRLLGDDLLEELVGASNSSMHRYQRGERTTPDHIADRLHTVTLIVADLAGSYNDFGIRRWFRRPRTQLHQRSPAEIMKAEWDPSEDDIRRVRELAAALVTPISA